MLAGGEQKRVKLQIWDTAGQDAYRSITSTYYKGADCVVLIYDSTSAESFDQLEQYWADQVTQNSKDDVLLAVAASKVDWAEKEDVSIKDASRFCKSINAKLYQTSAKDGTGIEAMFRAIAE